MNCIRQETRKVNRERVTVMKKKKKTGFFITEQAKKQVCQMLNLMHRQLSLQDEINFCIEPLNQKTLVILTNEKIENRPIRLSIKKIQNEFALYTSDLALTELYEIKFETNTRTDQIFIIGIEKNTFQDVNKNGYTFIASTQKPEIYTVEYQIA